MRNHVGVLVAVMGALLLSTAVAYAGVSNPADAYTGVGEVAGVAFGTTDQSNLEINSGGFGGCDLSRTTYLKWDLIGINKELGSASKLTLYVNNAQTANTGSVTLYEVSDDTWEEATVTGSTAPGVGNSIVSVPIPTAPGLPLIVFTGPEFATWLNKNTSYVGGNDNVPGNDKVSFAVRVTSCAGFSNPVRFDSKDKANGVAPILEVRDPTAVTLSTFSSTNPTTNWPLIAGLAGLVALIAAGGTWIYRKRAAVRA